MAKVPGAIKERARRLRGTPTAAEQRLWTYLRGRQLHGWHFRRQHPIQPYVVDFACLRARLVVEVDGGQHAESARDRERDRYLRQRGWRVLRFWNNDVLGNIERVMGNIAAALAAPVPMPPPRPSPADAGEGADGPRAVGGKPDDANGEARCRDRG